MMLPDATVRFLEAAARLGLDPAIHHFPDGTKTSADAAAAVGCELSAIAKSLVFMADDQPVVAILSGDRRVDPAKLAAVVGAESARRATLDEARHATGYAAGGTPAFGYPAPVPVVIDRALFRHDEVWSAAGTPTTVYPIELAALVAASAAQVVDVALEEST
ncbi:MAG: YbaK/EbsC family protein [Acidimicrobiia bacterium]|nr:YbaK/EbsC family protein [Acidimicrobiia bacterium]MBT8218041.1 YbaK/EbsC family protein [Acidimicrobiia bacterium]NNF09365.1 YbaK/EbsC family protein [Acidimicrobiia bacterium]NNL71196.1 YbaK/EbsC family protein [Acidimicrobiia bacterium]